MVAINATERRTNDKSAILAFCCSLRSLVICIMMFILVVMIVWMSMAFSLISTLPEIPRSAAAGVALKKNKLDPIQQERQEQQQQKQQQSAKNGLRSVEQQGYQESNGNKHKHDNPDLETSATPPVCPYQSLSDLTPEERYPKASDTRHMVDPPAGGWVALVCCQTTKGPWSIMVHEKWAPLGAQRFLDMVHAKYFSTRVPLMRCVPKFLCQFGLNGPVLENSFGATIEDDPQWLPAGPTHRENEWGVKRFAKGYFSYAGAGDHSRSNQIFVALQDSGPLGGGSTWEVPWGELVGAHSFAVLDEIYTGYGEDGPKQGFLMRHDSNDPALLEQFPLLDYVTSCQVVDRQNDGDAIEEPHEPRPLPTDKR